MNVPPPSPVHLARWFASKASPELLFNPADERALLLEAVADGGAPAGEPSGWGELQWAQLFREPPGPAMRPVFAWRAAVRLLLCESGPAAATEVLLAHVRRHGRRRLSAGQEAPAARDVRRALALASDEVYQAALAAAEAHRAEPEGRRLAAYLFPDRPWWRAELEGEDWLDLAPCPADLAQLPTQAPRGVDRSYLRTLAVAHGDAAVPLIAAWTSHDNGLAEVLLDMDSDVSVQAWVGLWDERAASDPGFREAITPAWSRCPVRLLRAGLRLTLVKPTLFRTVQRWLSDHPHAAAALEPTLQGAEAELLERLRPNDQGLPEGWGRRVLGSRRFRPPRPDGLDLEAAAHAAPAHLSEAGERVGPPRTWSRGEARERLLKVGRRGASDLVGWVLQDAGFGLAVGALLDTAGELGSTWFHPSAERVRNGLAWASAEAYERALAVAIEARGPAPGDAVAALSAYLFPDQPWWSEVVEGWASERDRPRADAIAQLVPLPGEVEALPELVANQLGLKPLVPSWLAAYGAALEPRLLAWLGDDSTSDGCIVEALLALGTPTAVQAAVRYAYEPFEGYRDPSSARQALDRLGEASPAALMRALASADLPLAHAALRRQVWRAPDAAEAADEPVVRELLAEVRPPRPPTPLDELPACFQSPRAAPDETAAVDRPRIAEAVRLSALEQQRVEAMRRAAEAPRTGFDDVVARIVSEGPEVLAEVRETIQSRTDATASVLDDLALVALAAHGPSAADAVRRTHEHYQAPPAALCTRSVAEWMIEHFDLTLIDVDRERCSEPLSEYRMDDVWRSRGLTREWIRRHPEPAAELVLWAASSPAGAGAALDDVHIQGNDLADLFAAWKSVDRGVSEDLRRGARQAIPWMLRHLPGLLERTAERVGAAEALAPWIGHPGPVTAAPLGDLAWLELWRLPWVELSDGRVLSRPAVRALLELLAHTDPVEPHEVRDAALAALAPRGALRLSEALRSQWEERYDAFGVWVVDAPGLLGDPEAEAWLRRLLTVGLEHVQDAAMNALYRKGDEALLAAERLSVDAMNGLLPWYGPGDALPRAVGLQARLDGLRALRGLGPWAVPRTAPPVAPPDGVRDERYAGRQVPLERFGALAATGWIGSDDRLALAVGPGLEVAIELPAGAAGVRTLGRVAVRDLLAPQRPHPLSVLSDADWGQVVADLDALTAGLAAPDKAASARQLSSALDRVAMRAKWACKWIASGDGAPAFLRDEAIAGLDAALVVLADLAAPFGGFVSVKPHAGGVFALVWRDGEQVVVGDPPEAPTGVGVVVTRARALLL